MSKMLKMVHSSYIICNQPVLKIFGFGNQKDFLGLNVNDIDKFMRPYWGKKYAENIAAIDYEVKTLGTTSTKKRDIYR